MSVSINPRSENFITLNGILYSKLNNERPLYSLSYGGIFINSVKLTRGHAYTFEPKKEIILKERQSEKWYTPEILSETTALKKDGRSYSDMLKTAKFEEFRSGLKQGDLIILNRLVEGDVLATIQKIKNNKFVVIPKKYSHTLINDDCLSFSTNLAEEARGFRIDRKATVADILSYKEKVQEYKSGQISNLFKNSH
jgi:hypothetical protein